MGNRKASVSDEQAPPGPLIGVQSVMRNDEPPSPRRWKRWPLRNKKVGDSASRSDLVTEEVPRLAGEHDVLTAAEVAKLKRVTTESVYQALRSGRLKGRKTNGTWLIRREDAVAWRTRKNATGC